MPRISIVVHEHVRTHTHTSRQTGREKDAGDRGRKKTHRRGIYYSGFTVITRRGRATPTGNGGGAYTRMGCVYPIRVQLVCAHLRVTYLSVCVCVRTYGVRNTDTRISILYSGASQHHADVCCSIPFPSECGLSSSVVARGRA